MNTDELFGDILLLTYVFSNCKKFADHIINKCDNYIKRLITSFIHAYNKYLRQQRAIFVIEIRESVIPCFNRQP